MKSEDIVFSSTFWVMDTNWFILKNEDLSIDVAVGSRTGEIGIDDALNSDDVILYIFVDTNVSMSEEIFAIRYKQKFHICA